MSLTGQTINISQSNVVSKFVLCHVINVGTSDDGNAPSRFVAKLRDTDVIKDSRRYTHDIECYVPDDYCDLVFGALRCGRYLLAEVIDDWLVSIIEIPDYPRIPKPGTTKPGS